TAQTRVVKASGSIAISGDRAHYAADLASNAVALVGVGAAAWLGLPWLDAAAGLLVALWLIWGAIGVFREASGQLMDEELPEEDRTRIVQLATVDPRVLGVHQLRTRASGPYVHMQMHADLAADISLAEAHTIMVAAENRLLEAFPSADIIIHPDPRGLAEKHGGVFAESVEG
ncbi:MAG: cation transporter, partial [Caulobacter sp.]|nr:cation transporter [Caulobacter sp.]